MYKILVTLMFVSAVKQLDLKIEDFKNCKSRQCLIKIEKASRKVLNINWKPIEMFPNEAKRFK